LIIVNIFVCEKIIIVFADIKTGQEAQISCTLMLI